MTEQYHILVIEDEQVVIDSVKKILIPEGFVVDAVLDAETALQKLKQTSYTLILVDLMLPKLSGLELAEIVRKAYPETLIIIITGYSTLDNAVNSLKAGAFDFTPKPFTFEEFLGVIYRGINFIEMNRPVNHNHASGRQNYNEKASKKYYFLSQHSWTKLEEDGLAVIGAGISFCQTVGDIQKIEFPPVDGKIKQGDTCVRFITQEEQLVHTVWAPLSGKVVENNREVAENTALIHTDPFSKGWLVRIKPTNLKMELGNLINY